MSKEAASQDEEDGQEDALVTAERTWFAKRLREGLTRTRGVLRAIKNDALDGGGDGLERLMQLTSLRAVVEALPGVSGDVFRSWFGWSWKRLRPVSPAKARDGYVH